MWMLGGAKPSTTSATAESSKPKLHRQKSGASRSSKKSNTSRKLTENPASSKRSKSVSSRKSRKRTLSKKSTISKKSKGGTGKQAKRTARSRSNEVSSGRKSRGRSKGSPKKRASSRRSVKSRSRLESRDDDAISIPLVDRIPTAVGYSSESSEDEWLEEQSKCSRYSSFVDGGFSEEDDFDDDKYSSASNLHGVDRLWSVSTDSSPEIGLEDDSVFAKFDYEEEVGPDPIYQTPKGNAPRAKRKTKPARSKSPKSKNASKSKGERSKSRGRSMKGSKTKAKPGSQASKATTVAIKNTRKRETFKKTLSPTLENDNLSTKMDGIDELRDSPPDSTSNYHGNSKTKHSGIEKSPDISETRPNKKSSKSFSSTTSTLSDSEYITLEADEMVAELERKIKELKAAAQEAKEELVSKLERKKLREAKIEEINRRARQNKKRRDDTATQETTTSSKSRKSKTSQAGSNKSSSKSLKSDQKSTSSTRKSGKSANSRGSSKSRSKHSASASSHTRRSKSRNSHNMTKTRRASSRGSSASASKRSRGRSNEKRNSSGSRRAFSDTRKKAPKGTKVRSNSTSRISKSNNRSKKEGKVPVENKRKEFPDLNVATSTQQQRENVDRKFLDAIERTRSDASVLGTNIIIDDSKSIQTTYSKASGRSRFFQRLRSRSYDRHDAKKRSEKAESIMYTKSLLSPEDDDQGLLELVSDEDSVQQRRKSGKTKKKGFLPRVLSSISRSKWTGAELKTSDSDLSVLKPRLDRKRKSKVIEMAKDDVVEKVSSPKSVEALDEYPEILVPQNNYEPQIVQCLRFYSCGAMAEGMNVALLAAGCHNPPPQLEYDFFEEEEDDIVYNGKSPQHAVEVVLEKSNPNRPTTTPSQIRRTQQVPMKKLNSMNCQTRNYSEQVYEDESLCLPSRPYVLDVTDKHLQLDSSSHLYTEKWRTPVRRRSASGAFSVTSIGVPTKSTTIEDDDSDDIPHDEMIGDNHDDTDDDNDENSAIHGKDDDAFQLNRKIREEFENIKGPKHKNNRSIRKLISRFRKKQSEGALLYI